MDELSKRISVKTWYRLSHITGPGAVYIGLCFGEMSADGPRIERSLRKGQNDGAIKFDLQRLIAEVLEGVAEANARNSAALQVEAIQVVPDDYPTAGQAKFVAYKLAERASQDMS